jgi:ElaB/YqjD/DUF883 family membrane-anchored ribosome-binding protein
MSNVDDNAQIPTLAELRKQVGAVRDQINELTGPSLGKVAAQVRDRPFSLALAALGIGLIGGYLLKR